MATLRVQRLCVQWPRFGPYHLARLRAAHAYLDPMGVELVGLETAGRDALYAWGVEAAPEPFRREQAFPERTFEAIPPAEIEAGVTAALDRTDPDAVAITSYSMPDARAALRWCRRRRRVAVVMTDSKADDAPRVAWREHVKRVLLSQYDAALVAGAPHRAYLLRLGFPAERIFSGYDVVDNAFFRAGAEAARGRPEAYRPLPGLERGGPFFLASNRFLPRKNLERLLLAYARYRAASAAPWGLRLLGDGPLRPELERTVAEHGIEGVVFCGFRQIAELPAYYGLAGAFVHPALADPWGLVVNEAMAAGLPVLVSARAGCAEDLVEDGRNGFTFDPERTDRLAELMARVAAPETDRAALGRRSQAIVSGFSPETFARQLGRAVQAGAPRAGRPLRPAAGALLWALRTLARRPDSFHSAPETLLFPPSSSLAEATPPGDAAG